MHLALVCRILLAIVLAGSAIGKLQDLDDSRQMMVDFGLPTPSPGRSARSCPASSWWLRWPSLGGPCTVGAGAALGLMGAFTLAVGLNMAAGRRPDCRCFGSLHVATIGWRVLTRNLLLMALAVLCCWKG